MFDRSMLRLVIALALLAILLIFKGAQETYQGIRPTVPQAVATSDEPGTGPGLIAIGTGASLLLVVILLTRPARTIHNSDSL